MKQKAPHLKAGSHQARRAADSTSGGSLPQNSRQQTPCTGQDHFLGALPSLQSLAGSTKMVVIKSAFLKALPSLQSGGESSAGCPAHLTSKAASLGALTAVEAGARATQPQPEVLAGSIKRWSVHWPSELPSFLAPALKLSRSRHLPGGGIRQVRLPAAGT